MPIVSGDEIAKAIFGLSEWASISSIDQNIIGELQTSVEALVDQHLGGSVGHASRTEVIEERSLSNGHDAVPYPLYRPAVASLYLRHLPVAVASLDIQEGESDTQLTQGTHYRVCESNGGYSRHGKVSKISGSWYFPVTVTYDGGFSEIASPTEWLLIKRAVIVALRDLFAAEKRNVGMGGQTVAGPIQSESIGSYSYTVDSRGASAQSGGLGGLPLSAVAILRPLVNMARHL